MDEVLLFLVEASLELIPPEIRSHPSIISDAKRRRRRADEILLNMSKHHRAIRGLRNWEKRGRPDIVHLSLLTALDSPLNKAGHLRIYVHTINGVIIEVNSKVRIPRSFDRFEGLVVQLFKLGRVPPEGGWLMRVVDNDLATLTSEADFRVGLSILGRRVNLRSYMAKLVNKLAKLAVIVGGFQRGHFSEEITSLLDDLVSISRFPLSSHLVVCKILSEAEYAMEVE